MPGDLPGDVPAFVLSTGGRSLLVKGTSGTGKTLFALQIAEEVSHAFLLHYISPHVSDESVRRQFPTLASHVLGRRPPIHHPPTPWPTPCPSCGTSFEVKTSKRPIEVVCPNCNAIQRLADRTELHRLIGYIQHSGEHPAEPSIPLDLPEIESTYDVVDAHLREPRLRTLVVIDPINALEEQYDIRAWRLVKTIQRDLVENTGMSVVFVVDSAGGTKLDPIVDGIVRISFPSSAHPAVRTLTIEKLRGHEILRRRFSLLLRGGRFREAAGELSSGLDA